MVISGWVDAVDYGSGNNEGEVCMTLESHIRVQSDTTAH